MKSQRPSILLVAAWIFVAMCGVVAMSGPAVARLDDTLLEHGSQVRQELGQVIRI